MSNLKDLDTVTRDKVDVMIKSQFSDMDYSVRMKYAKMMIQYNLTEKLFDIKYTGDAHEFLCQLEKKLKINSVCQNKNGNKMFVNNSQITANDSYIDNKQLLIRRKNY